MQKIVMSLALGLLISSTASASEKSDVLATIHKWVDSFNAGDAKTMSSLCSDEAVVVDDFSPHLWQGAGACGNWGKDYDAFAKTSKITEPKVTLGKAKHLDVDASYAYVVAPTSYTFNQDGKPTKEAAQVTMTLHKVSGVWKITAWAWADM